MPPVTCATESVPTIFAPGWAPAVLTSRGVAACRLSEFADVWSEFSQADCCWFVEWLTELLVDACQEPALREPFVGGPERP